MSDTFPDIVTPDVRLAFEHLCKTMDAAAKGAGATLCDVALTWHMQHGKQSGFNCIFSEGLTPDVAEGMAGILLMDADEADWETTLPPVVRQ